MSLIDLQRSCFVWIDLFSIQCLPDFSFEPTYCKGWRILLHTNHPRIFFIQWEFTPKMVFKSYYWISSFFCSITVFQFQLCLKFLLLVCSQYVQNRFSFHIWGKLVVEGFMLWQSLKEDSKSNLDKTVTQVSLCIYQDTGTFSGQVSLPLLDSMTFGGLANWAVIFKISILFYLVIFFFYIYCLFP